jgi:cold shock CspA family protein
MIDETRHFGEVISFDKGWGFLLDYDTQESIFVHWSEIEGEGYKKLYPLDSVSFLVGEGRNNRLQAMKVQVIKEG